MENEKIAHRYFKRTKKEQKKIQLCIALLALLFNIFIIIFSIFTGVYFLPVIFIIVTLSIIAPFFDVPSMVKKGKLEYLSPLLLAERRNEHTIVLHGGTLFDYVFVLDRKMNGTQRTKIVLQGYVEGLIHLIDHYDGCDEDFTIKGTSYILNVKTLERVGFRKVKTGKMQSLILIYNYFNLMSSISLAKKRLTFPKLTKITTFECSLNALKANEEILKKLNEQMNISFSHEIPVRSEFAENHL